jgi:hypothetical protein
MQRSKTIGVNDCLQNHYIPNWQLSTVRLCNCAEYLTLESGHYLHGLVNRQRNGMQHEAPHSQDGTIAEQPIQAVFYQPKPAHLSFT